MELPHRTARRVRSARYGVFAFFIGMGLALGTYVSRIPSVRDALGLSPTGLAVLFIVGSIGGLIAFTLLGGLVAKLGSLRLVRIAVAVNIASFAAMGVAAYLGTAPGFGIALFFALASLETVNALANAEAATIERLVGRSIMSQFHAAFSLAVLAGVGIGALVSQVGVDVGAHYAVNATVIGAVLLALSGTAIIDGHAPERDSAERTGGMFVTLKVAARERRTLAIGFIIFCAFTIEVSAGNWIPLSIVDDYGRSEALGATFFAVLVVAQSAARIMGAPIIARFGRVTLLRACGTLVALGALIFAFTPTFWAVAVALVLWGVGSAFGYPISISAASDDRTNATARVAAVAAFGTVAGLTMPQVIGLIAEHTELRKALLVTVVAAAAMAVLAPAARVPDDAEGAREASVEDDPSRP